ncbi:MBL fold metallo-hydrolase [Iocasia frigidifontis]|uniref:MBL fold metallo-hydrolase n=1 Tax=Iocasia fonsfrigidae TaxID=2682810 RepID=A0A8A7K6Y1_9FIRM|nr:MBL fold metallo-hydrolase [Iocasia fonsfrigidae]QTL97543.1 MBL fold metallo-hydrolase [Iocasia fonsfrigidae]
MKATWFTVEEVDNKTFAISEYNHWEKVHSYLILGNKIACLIDTGLGIGNIKQITDSLTDLPVKVITTHVHWDHIGGHSLFDNISVHENDVEWMRNGIPVPIDNIKINLVKGVRKELLPENFNINDYDIFKGEPRHILNDGEKINLGNRELLVLHTPGHSPGHICLYEKERGYLYTGDLLYKGTLYAFYPSTNPNDYYKSIIKISKLDYVDKILPGHNDIVVNKKLIIEIRQAFEELKEKDLLKHGSGLHEYSSFKIKL